MFNIASTHILIIKAIVLFLGLKTLMMAYPALRSAVCEKEMVYNSRFQPFPRPPICDGYPGLVIG